MRGGDPRVPRQRRNALHAAEERAAEHAPDARGDPGDLVHQGPRLGHAPRVQRSQILTGKVAPNEGLKQAAQQINALEAASATTWGKAAAVSAQVKAEIADAGTGRQHAFTPPSRSGVGQPATAGTALVSVQNGQYTLLGDGADVWGGADNCAVAAAATTDDRKRRTGPRWRSHPRKGARGR